jgi:hypothetical protein
MLNAPLLRCLYFYRCFDLTLLHAGYKGRSHEGEQGQADSGRLRHRDRSHVRIGIGLHVRRVLDPGDLLAVLGHGASDILQPLQRHRERPGVPFALTNEDRQGSGDNRIAESPCLTQCVGYDLASLA